MFAVGFVGFGEAGYNLAKGLGTEGLDCIFAYDIATNSAGSGELIRSRAADARVTLVDSAEALVHEARLVIAAVPATSCLDAGHSALPHMRTGQLYVDVSTASPGDKLMLANEYLAAGALYVDSAMMGSVPGPRHKVPMLASGDGAQEWRETMTPYHMKIEAISGEAGRATQIKLTRSIFMKGMEGLLLETLLAARKCGIEDVIIDSLVESIGPGFRKAATDLVLSDAIHSRRRAHEARESARLLEELAIEPIMTTGTAHRLEWSSSLNLKDRFGGETPSSLADLFRAWEDLGLI